MSQSPACRMKAPNFFVKSEGLEGCQLTCLQQFSRLNKALGDLDKGVTWRVDAVQLPVGVVEVAQGGEFGHHVDVVGGENVGAVAVFVDRIVGCLVFWLAQEEVSGVH